MKKLAKIFVSLLCAALLTVPVLCAACNPDNKEEQDPPPEENFDPVDYVSELTLDLRSNSKKVEVTVRLYVDGDTTHFDPVQPTSDFAETQGYIKARYLAINTPESTGKIEEWGKAASKFTRSKLESAESIIVESDDGKWNLDSTGGRYLLWVWYRPQGATEYRNLNVEILQNGYAIASATANNRYGMIASRALEQARKMKLHVFSGEKDPDFFYGDAIPLTMKELRCHIADYEQQKVAVEGVITSQYSNSVYAEDYYADEDIYFGISVYYGNGASGDLLKMYSVGNRVKIIGTVSYYEGSGTYQISGVSYNAFRPDSPNNSQLISTDNSGAFTEVAVGKLYDDIEFKFETEKEDGTAGVETITLKYGEALMSTSVALNNLKVTEVYTTENGGSSDGAMSLTCQTADGNQIVVRTAVLKDGDGKLITAEAFEGKTISVRGIIDKYDNSYQVFCYTYSNITIAN